MMDVARRLEKYIAFELASSRAPLRELIVANRELLHGQDPTAVGAVVGKGEWVASAATTTLIAEVTVVKTGCEPRSSWPLTGRLATTGG